MKGSQKIGEDIRNEFIGVINYSIIALIQLENGIAEQPDMTNEKFNFRTKNTTTNLKS